MKYLPPEVLCRAQRSLARNATRRGDWSSTARHWERALALNPLNPEGWFCLGFAYIKQKDYPKALQVALLEGTRGWECICCE